MDSQLTGNPRGGYTETNREKWMELCELAAREPDPNKLLALTNEIARLLDEKRKSQVGLPGTQASSKS